VAPAQSVTSFLDGHGGLGAAESVYAKGLSGVPAELRPVAASLANWDRGADLARVVAITKVAPESKQAEALVERIRDRSLDFGLQGQARVGGSTAFNLDLEHEVSGRLPVVVGAVLALSFLLLMMAFRSLLLPLKAILMNLL